MPDPRNIASNDELRAIHEAGDGLVFNTFGNKLHASSCDYVRGMTVNERKWFFSTRGDAEAALAARRPGGWATCPQCLGSGDARPRPISPAPAQKLRPIAATQPATNQAEVRGPGESRRVEAWADVYVQYPPTARSQSELRTDLSRRVGMLEADDDEVLHAVFSGPKHPQADVENLLTYNIDDTGRCFESAARNGVRFEHASSKAGVSPSGLACAYSFRYTLQPTDASFHNWRPTRTLVEFDGLRVAAAASGPRLADVWFALKRSPVTPSRGDGVPDCSFAVMVQVAPPAGPRPVVVRQVKAIVDGIVCAFQAHGKEATLGEMTRRVAQMTGASEAEVRMHLTDRERAVLGVAKSLLHAWGEVVQWSPADTRCVAGELLMEPASGTDWTLSGRVVELSRMVASDS